MSLLDLFTRKAENYRDRLSPFEQEMFDAFHRAQIDHPDHLVFAVVAEPGKPDCFETYRSPDVLRNINDEKARRKIYIALALNDDFQSQWVKEPDGQDHSSFYRQYPVLRYPVLSPRNEELCDGVSVEPPRSEHLRRKLFF